MNHRFSLGQTVLFTPGGFEVLRTVASGTITRLLPKDVGTDANITSRSLLTESSAGRVKISLDYCHRSNRKLSMALPIRVLRLIIARLKVTDRASGTVGGSDRLRASMGQRANGTARQYALRRWRPVHGGK
jgi:hypothetical protein